jgi:hypothetical protein
MIYYCEEIKGTSKAQDLFNIIYAYMTVYFLEWSNCVCTNRAHSMSGICTGLQAFTSSKISLSYMDTLHDSHTGSCLYIF